MSVPLSPSIVTLVPRKAPSFRDREEVLRVYNSGEALVKQLTAVSPLCQSIGTDIKIAPEPIAKGVTGSVSDVVFPGAKKGQYVIKTFFGKGTKGTTLVRRFVRPPKTLEEAIKSLKEYDPDLLLAVNGGDPTKVVAKIMIPAFAMSCSPKTKFTYVTNVSNRLVTLTKPYYLCPTEAIPEYVMSLLVANLYRDGTCVHFIDTVDLLTCVEVGSPKQHTIMEKVDGPLSKFVRCLFKKKKPDSRMITGVLIQILFAIACYQHRYQISHNDLHTGNVLLKHVTPDTEWNGQKLADADWYHYHILGVDLYVPSIPTLVKIADFGYSVKWSPPIIGDEFLATKGLGTPTEYAPQYDSLMAIFAYANTKVDFVVAALKAAIGDATDVFSDKDRPYMNRVGEFSDATAVNLLTNKTLMAEYTLKPTTGKIVTLGHLS